MCGRVCLGTWTLVTLPGCSQMRGDVWPVGFGAWLPGIYVAVHALFVDG